jgi:hypothetical protein
MKRVFASLMALSLMASLLTGCGNGNPSSSTGDTSNDSANASSNVSSGAAEEGPALTVTSDILGLADTGNKTTLKQDLIYTSGPGDINIYYYDEDGNRVIYENQEEQQVAMDPVTYTGSAVFDLGSDVDDGLIDSSNAVVSIAEGSGYFQDEYILSATTLNGTWNNGKYEYTLSAGDITFNNWGYDTSVDYNSDREWSIMGGDGNGVYHINLEVSGIRYNGVEVPAATFPVVIYTYGRSAVGIGISSEYVPNTYDPTYTSGLKQGEETKWTWRSENIDAMIDDKPYMNDLYTDYISVIWPEGTDASDITADDVTVTLHSGYGEDYTLSTLTAYGEEEYAVLANAGETVVAITYQQWAFYPVYSTMTVTVDNGTLSATKDFDIASVAVNMTQTGGGGVTVDHTVTCYNFYGVSGMTLENAANTTYTLSTEVDGATMFYAEKDGVGYLTKDSSEAWQGDGTEKYHIAVLGNVVYVETRLDTTEEKTVDGVTYTFNQNLGVVNKSAADMIAGGATLVPGYNLSGSNVTKWAWTYRYQSGWTTYTAKPTGLPYVDGAYPYGYEPGSSNSVYTEENIAAESSMGGSPSGSGPSGKN